MQKNKFYITTTLPYVNAEPHIGFALEIIQADAIARYHRMMGHDVVFNTGTDEHGIKIYRKAVEQGKDPQAYVDEYAARFAELKDALNLTYTHFIRTTDAHHKKAAQEFWNRCLARGDIYKKDYAIKYCVGCELEKTDSDLQDDRCPLHPNLAIEDIKEENYFFKFSAYGEKLLKWYEDHPDFVLPSSRFNEIRRFVEEGLHDFSISRLKSKMPWGVPVPGDGDQVMYVWFDALVNYISTLGWPQDQGSFESFWPGVQIAGKDNLRQQSAIWQAMLLSAGLPPSQQILIHGFITADGQKISKSLGNVIDPFGVVKRYGIDPLRYYLLREIPSGDDGDFSYKNLEARYTSDLANGLGNLVQRVATLVENNLDKEIIFNAARVAGEESLKELLNDVRYEETMKDFMLHETLADVWKKITLANVYVNDHKPWVLAKEDPEKFLTVMTVLVAMINHIAWLLQPFMPGTSQKIFSTFGLTPASQIPDGARSVVVKGEPLFPRLG